jgi:hypothetical protein
MPAAPARPVVVPPARPALGARPPLSAAVAGAAPMPALACATPATGALGATCPAVAPLVFAALGAELEQLQLMLASAAAQKNARMRP